IEKIRNAHAKQIPNKKHIMYSNYRIGSERYDDIVNGRIYPQPPKITFIDLSISTPQPEILSKHNLSNARNTEQLISLSKSATKKTSRKKISQNEELPSSNINKTNSGVELSKGKDQSELKIINHSTSSISKSDVQTRIENLREYKKQL
ncbi:13496_t:CDS:1, partial [Gigaspora margarita]